MKADDACVAAALINKLNWLLLQEQRTLIDLTLFYEIDII